MPSICSYLYELLVNACQDKICDGLLLSGGLDSTIVAHFLKPFYLITVLFDRNSPDGHYSSLVSSNYPGKHYKIYPSQQNIFENLIELIQEYKTFDPIFIKNTLVQMIGFKKSVELNIKTLALGDGADELFGGYNFLVNYIKDSNELNLKLNSLIDNMDFISFRLAKRYNLEIFLPFLNKDIVTFAKNLPPDKKISQHGTKYYGKFLLRQCFENIIGEELSWRTKQALERGSGMDGIVDIINTSINDQDFLKGKIESQNEKVRIRDKEHLYYYKIYRRFYKPPFKDYKQTTSSNSLCQGCNSIFIYSGNFCKVCGFYPNIFHK